MGRVSAVWPFGYMDRMDIERLLADAGIEFEVIEDCGTDCPLCHPELNRAA